MVSSSNNDVNPKSIPGHPSDGMGCEAAGVAPDEPGDQPGDEIDPGDPTVVTTDPFVFSPQGFPVPDDLSAEFLSQPGLLFTADCEGFRATPYNDSNNNCTVGYGHLLHRGACTNAEIQNGTVDRQAALATFRRDLNTAEAAVRANVTVPLTQEQFDALVDFTYNLGAGNLQNSTLLRELNQGHYDRVAQEMQRWGRGGAGIPARRANEGNLFDGNGYPIACYQHP